VIVFSAFEHVLQFTIYPFRLLMGTFDSWTIFAIALLVTIGIKRLLNKYEMEVRAPRAT